MRSSDSPSKHEVFLALLRKGWTSLHLDARHPGVIVPAHLRSEPYLVLQYGHDLPIPIPDLEVDEHGVCATLSFSKSPQRTVIPWAAVYVVSCTDGHGVLFREDVPHDVSIIPAHPTPDQNLPDEVLELSAEMVGSAGDGTPRSATSGGKSGTTSGTATGGSPGSNGPSGRISERLLRSVPADGTGAGGDDALDQPVAGRRRRKPQLRLVK